MSEWSFFYQIWILRESHTPYPIYLCNAEFIRANLVFLLSHLFFVDAKKSFFLSLSFLIRWFTVAPQFIASNISLCRSVHTFEFKKKLQKIAHAHTVQERKTHLNLNVCEPKCVYVMCWSFGFEYIKKALDKHCSSGKLEIKIKSWR